MTSKTFQDTSNHYVVCRPPRISIAIRSNGAPTGLDGVRGARPLDGPDFLRAQESHVLHQFFNIFNQTRPIKPFLYHVNSPISTKMTRCSRIVYIRGATYSLLCDGAYSNRLAGVFQETVCWGCKCIKGDNWLRWRPTTWTINPCCRTFWISRQTISISMLVAWSVLNFHVIHI
ncbi:uncharacterized protein [Argopecten irradians]|uniref:uncharacterized protein n=1 Tax=Argopecten irradians TaxID=31199 RepID=UPI00371AA1BD